MILDLVLAIGNHFVYLARRLYTNLIIGIATYAWAIIQETYMVFLGCSLLTDVYCFSSLFFGNRSIPCHI